jgi:hypothetical protein
LIPLGCRIDSIKLAVHPDERNGDVIKDYGHKEGRIYREIMAYLSFN